MLSNNLHGLYQIQSWRRRNPLNGPLSSLYSPADDSIVSKTPGTLSESMPGRPKVRGHPTAVYYIDSRRSDGDLRASRQLHGCPRPAQSRITHSQKGTPSAYTMHTGSSGAPRYAKVLLLIEFDHLHQRLCQCRNACACVPGCSLGMIYDMPRSRVIAHSHSSLGLGLSQRPRTTTLFNKL